MLNRASIHSFTIMDSHQSIGKANNSAIPLSKSSSLNCLGSLFGYAESTRQNRKPCLEMSKLG